MKWKTFEKYLPTDGERILILTTGCGVSAAEGFFFERKSVEKYFKSGLISDNIVQKIRKTEIDSSIISLNRKYNVKVFSGYEKYQGNYILSSKKETLIRQGDDFMIEVLIGLRKVK